jgi:hypothetical protein
MRASRPSTLVMRIRHSSLCEDTDFGDSSVSLTDSPNQIVRHAFVTSSTLSFPGDNVRVSEGALA